MYLEPYLTMEWGAVVSLRPVCTPQVSLELNSSFFFLAQEELVQEPRYLKAHSLSLVFALVAWISVTANVYVLITTQSLNRFIYISSGFTAYRRTMRAEKAAIGDQISASFFDSFDSNLKHKLVTVTSKF